MNVYPTVREDLRQLLLYGGLQATGVGYSEFLNAAVQAFERGEFEIPGVERHGRPYVRSFL